jgi:hypothetical protein
MWHHICVHLSSSTEAALAASAITAVSAWLVAVTAWYLNSRRDHKARLWERRANVYEYMLSRTEYWADGRRNVFAEGPNPACHLALFENDRQLLLTRLELFGQRKVLDTYRQAADKHRKFIIEMIRYRIIEDLIRWAVKVSGGDINSASQSSLPKARADLIAVNEIATAAQMELIAVTRKAINELPKPERRLWERRRHMATDSLPTADALEQVQRNRPISTE